MIPFLKLYTDGISDVNYLDEKVLVLFLVFYLLQNGRKASQTVINIAQHFEKTKWRSVAEAAINVISSVILTAKFGIYGVLLGSIIALLYRTNDVVIYAARILERSSWITYRRWIVNVATLFVIGYIASHLNLATESYPQLFLYGIILVCTVVPIFILTNSIFEIKYANFLVKGIKKKILKGNKQNV